MGDAPWGSSSRESGDLEFLLGRDLERERRVDIVQNSEETVQRCRLGSCRAPINNVLPIGLNLEFIRWQCPSYIAWPVRFNPSFAMALFGDIIATANIAHSFYKALSDSTGSSYEYQCLIEEVHSFEQALRAVDLAISVTLPGGRLAQYIEAEITRCLELLTKFLDGIKSSQKALGGPGKGPNSWR